jgi:hypothetical protein
MYIHMSEVLGLAPGDEGPALAPLLGRLADAGLLHPVHELLVHVEIAR